MTQKPIRLTWPDMARGACVMLVVLHHVIRQMVDQAPESWQMAGAAWTVLDDFLTPIRIPLFFFISGLLVQRSLSRPWGETRKRWVVPVYLYVLWSTLLTLRLLLPWGDHEHSFLSNFFGNLVLAGSGYWYLYALPLYYLYSRVTRRWPWWLALLPLLPGLAFRDQFTEWMQSAGYEVMDSASLLGSILANAAFYWIGARYGAIVMEALRNLRWLVSTSLVLGYTAVQSIAIAAGSVDAVVPVVSLLGIGVGILVASRASSDALPSRGLRYVGERTLPVYVLQFFFVSVLSLAWSRMGSMPIIDQMPLLAWLYPVLVTTAIVLVSLGVYRVANLFSALRWLFTPPERWTRPAATPDVGVRPSATDSDGGPRRSV
ncbi:acyltransferase family protein [Microbacterium sp. EYE_512]|nr:acyltransferase family protein [Microbacterium sp. EYE_512]